MAVNKVIYGNTTLIDLTSDTVSAASMLEGVTAHDKSGAVVVGSCTYDADTSDATASASEILSTKTAYVGGSKVTGSMTNQGGVTGSISDVNGSYSIPAGYHDGSGRVGIDSVEQEKLIPSVIKKDITVLGVTGTYGGESATAQTKSVTPYITAQTVLPDAGYDYLSQVNVAAIYYNEVDNAAGGKTVTIGTAAPV